MTMTMMNNSQTILLAITLAASLAVVFFSLLFIISPRTSHGEQQQIQLLQSNKINCSSHDDEHPPPILRQKKPLWIYLLGDSSLRILNAALVEHFNGSLQDPMFGSYIIHNKGGCIQEDDGDRRMGCLREYISWERRVRITFSFKTFATQPTEVLNHLTSSYSSAQPDIFVLATAAHDFYHAHSIGDTLQNTLNWLKEMRLRYPSSKLVFCNLVACHPSFKAYAIPFNAQMDAACEKTNCSEFQILDRQWNTINENNSTLCEGWHAQGKLALQHMNSLLEMTKSFF